MNFLKKTGLGTAIIIAPLLAAPLANATSPAPASGELASIIENRLNTPRSSQRAFVYKFLLDMGARANGTKKDSPNGAHAAWCAKIHKTYDPATNTFTAFNGKKFTCHSPY